MDKKFDKIKAICCSNEHALSIKSVDFPKTPEPRHLIIKTDYCGLNHGDIAFIKGYLPNAPKSMYEICGVSGSGRVIQIGEGVPEKYINKKVAIYRSLSRSSKTIGAWSEYAHLHYTACLILPESADLLDYCGSLVNTITPYSFLESINYDASKAIISTAGNSATGLALLGICLSKGYSMISIVQRESSIKRVQDLGGRYVLSHENPDFEKELQSIAGKINAGIVFDGIGGSALNRVIKCLPNESIVYTYGFLGDSKPLDISAHNLCIRGLTLTGFSVFYNRITLNTSSLSDALDTLQEIIHMPHFKTNVKKVFPFEEIDKAVTYMEETNSKVAISFS